MIQNEKGVFQGLEENLNQRKKQNVFLKRPGHLQKELMEYADHGVY